MNKTFTFAALPKNLAQLQALPEAVIYVYDNNSSDGTDEIARKAGAIVRYEYQQGKGNAKNTGNLHGVCLLILFSELFQNAQTPHSPSAVRRTMFPKQIA